MSAYFRMSNVRVHQHSAAYHLSISDDDAYSPAYSVDRLESLVESAEVFLILCPLVPATNAAPFQNYMTKSCLAALLSSWSGSPRWVRPRAFSWTIGLHPNYRLEARSTSLYP